MGEKYNGQGDEIGPVPGDSRTPPGDSSPAPGGPTGAPGSDTGGGPPQSRSSILRGAVAEDVEGESLVTLVLNKLRGTLAHPGPGPNKAKTE